MLKTSPFSKNHRLRSSKEFRKIFGGSQKLRTPNFSIHIAKNVFSHARLGITVAKAQVASAVKRNCIKRVLRESFRLNPISKRSLDLVVVVSRRFLSLDRATQREMLDKQWEKIIDMC